MGIPRPNFIVGIGGSAGALNAYKALLNTLPPKTGMAFVIISHMNPAASSQLALILSLHTKMPVAVAAMAMPILANHVYVIPPDADLFIADYIFIVASPRSKRNVQVDMFLTSLALAMEAYAVGIILSGMNGDGAAGCRQIKAKGGTMFAQDSTAEFGSMPLSAQATGCVDLVLSPAAMSGELRKLASTYKKGGDAAH